MAYLDLEYKLRTDGDFRHLIINFARTLQFFDAAARRDAKFLPRYRETLNDFLLLCNRNLVMLTPFFFPKYPKGKPLNFAEYPFAWNLFSLEIGASTTVRGSRQISKSTAIAALQLLCARLLPNFGSMYLVPRNDQLDTYQTRLRDMERAQFDYAERDSDLRSNLRLKEFSNGSKIELVYAHTSATNVRGKSTDLYIGDECLLGSMLIGVPGGSDILVDLKPGAAIVAFDEHNNLKQDRVVRIINRGHRPAWRVTLSDGNFLECTSNERLHTNHGWLYLSQIMPHSENLRCRKAVEVEALVAEHRAAFARHVAGRRQHVLRQQERDISGAAWRSSTGVLRSKVPSIERLCANAGQNCSKLRMGQGELCLLDGDYASLELYTRTVLPPGTSVRDWQAELGQVCQSNVVGPTDVGRACVLVYGRRKPQPLFGQHMGSEFQYSRIHEEPSGAFGAYSDSQGCVRQSTQSQKERQGVLDDPLNSGFYESVSTSHQAVCTSVNDVQGSVVSEHDVLHVLQRPYRERTYRADYRSPMLREAGVPTPKRSGSQSPLAQQTGEQAKKQRTSQGGAKCEPASAPSTSPGVATHTRSRSGIQGEVGEAPDGIEIGLLQNSRRESQEGQGRCSISPSEETALGCLEPARIVSIEYIGEHEVWDIETEKYHTFFANGVAVHNCQDFDPDLEIEVEMMQSASETPMNMYTGTSLTTETFLEKKYLDSSQASWIIKCPGCNHENIPLPEHGVMEMIQPQGPSCGKCGKLLDVTSGRFVHADMKALAESRYGYHIPQLIVPAVVHNEIRWERLYRQKNKGNKSKFLQEILGIPVEEGERELTRKNLEDMCTLGKPSELLRKAQAGRYQWVVAGCDWGGSDYQPMTKTKISTTVHCIIGITPDGWLDILHFDRLTGMGYDDIIGKIAHDFKMFKGYAMASDTGVGAVYNDKLRYHIPAERHLMITYTGPTAELLAMPAKQHIFNTWMLNKTESLTLTFDAIRNKKIRCFDWANAEEYLLDCLNMFRAPGEKAGGAGANTFVYRASATKPNDALQAINYAHMLARIVQGEPMFADQSMKLRMEETLRGTFNFQPGTGGGGAFSG